jgi:hypothetical protein
LNVSVFETFPGLEGCIAASEIVPLAVSEEVELVRADEEEEDDEREDEREVKERRGRRKTKRDVRGRMQERRRPWRSGKKWPRLDPRLAKPSQIKFQQQQNKIKTKEDRRRGGEEGDKQR